MSVIEVGLVAVPLVLVDAGPNDRHLFDDGELRTLADSIARDGLAQPPTLRPKSDGRYEIVAGERRTRACRMLGWETMPAIIRELDDDAASAIMLVENLVRVNLDAIEEARAYRSRLDQGSTLAELSALVGVGQLTIRDRLALLELSDDAQRLVSSGNLRLGHAAQMVGLDANRQHVALMALGQAEMPLTAFRALCDRLRGEQSEDCAIFDPEMFFQVEEYAASAMRAAEEAKMAKLSAMDESDMLQAREVAARVGITATSLRTYRQRGVFPKPDGHFGSTPWWKRATVDSWIEHRRSPGRPRSLFEQ